jgi:polyisoprenyl-teichoic acid--peptidoglycan teichoic acid transferase
MRNLTNSIFIGAGLAIFFVGVTFAAFSVFRPGWLRQVTGAKATPVSVATLVAIVEAGGQVPNVTPIPTAMGGLAPTPAPLPTLNGACGGPQQMTIALLGMDTRGDQSSFRARTDAITLLNVNFASQSAAMLSVPRDLFVPLPNLGAVGIDQDRINTAFLFGDIYGVPGGGPAEFKQTVELNLGIRVDRYVLINFGALQATVDALGGIDINVPTAIYDPDFPADQGDGTLVLDIPAGPQHMDGAMALRYARTRHQDDDYHRVKRQQAVLLAMRDKLVNPQAIAQIPALLAALQKLGRTDLSPSEIAALACVGPRIDRSAIQALSIDGSMIMPWTTPGGASVSIPNRDLMAPVVQRFMGNP